MEHMDTWGQQRGVISPPALPPPLVWEHEGRSSPSYVAALSRGQTHILPVSWLALELPV